MKKTLLKLSVCFGVVLLLLMAQVYEHNFGLNFDVFAAEEVVNSEETVFDYEENDGEITIKGFKPENKDAVSIVIPQTINSKPVTKIADNAFEKLIQVKTISLPDGLKIIGEKAFNYNAITELIIPDSVIEIGKEAFGFCTYLTDVKLPKSLLVINDSTFYYCSSLKSVSLPDTLKEIGEKAFYSNSSITELVIPDSVTKIGKDAFSSCSKLTDIKLPQNLDSINDGTFSNCLALATVSLPENIMEIGRGAFENSGLKEISIPDGVTQLQANIFYNCRNLVNVQLPELLKIIDEYAFGYCSSLKKVVLPGSVLLIGKNAFAGSGLTEITLNEGLKEIGVSAFDRTEIVEFTIPSTVKVVDNPIGMCQNLTTITIKSADRITLSLSGCDNLEFVDIPDFTRKVKVTNYTGTKWYKNQPNGILYFDTAAVTCKNDGTGMGITDTLKFAEGTTYIAETVNGSGIKKVIMPDTVRVIDERAFLYFSDLTEIRLSESLEIIGDSAFNGAGFKKIYIPASVREIDTFAFYKCENLTEVTGMENVETINGRAFKECSALESFKLSDKLTVLSEGLFEACSSLSEVIYGKGLKKMYLDAFNGTKISTIYIPETVDEIEAGWFENLMNFDIEVSENNKAITLKDGVLFTEFGEVLVWCTDILDSEEYTIPEGVKTILAYAFYGHKELKKLNFPKSLESIEYGAFSKCDNLSQISFQEGLKHIGEMAFSCKGYVKELILPDSLIEISENSFNDMTFDRVDMGDGLTKITPFNAKELVVGVGVTKIEDNQFPGSPYISIILPDTITSIGKNAFHCRNLKSIVIPDSVIDMGANAFANCVSLENITLSKNITAIPDSAFSGCSALSEITLPNKIETIGEKAFYNCEKLKKITFNDKLRSIGANAFENCKQLTVFKVPSSLETISDRAFLNCDRIENIELGNNLKTVGSSVFEGCKALKNVNIPDNFTLVSDGLFKGCSKLQKVVIGKAVKTIGSNSFADCVSLVSVIFNGSPEQILSSTFKGCTALKSITIPEGVTSLGVSAFENCTGLTQIKLPESLKVIGGKAFLNCSKVKEINLGPNVSEIGANAFENCTALKSLTIPESVTVIYNKAFYGCSNMEKITYKGNDAIKIGAQAFAGTKWYNNLPDQYIIYFGKTLVAYKGTLPKNSKLIIKEGVSNIGAEAFCAQKNLVSVVFPESLLSIENGAFKECSSLKEIIIPVSVRSIGESAFESCTKLSTIDFKPEGYVKIGQKAFYRTAWFNNQKGKTCYLGKNLYAYNGQRIEFIATIKSDTISISDGAFRNVSTGYLKATIPASVRYIGAEAFYNPNAVSVEINFRTTVCNIAPAKTTIYSGLIDYVKGYKNSSAIVYARKNGLNYDEVAEHEHSYSTVITKATPYLHGSINTECTCGVVSDSKVISSPNAVTLSTTSYTYNGKVKTPAVTVKDSDGNLLKKGTDYELKYKGDRKLPGEYTVTVLFKGKYIGQKHLNFNIKPKTPTTISATQSTSVVKLTWSKSTGATGYRVYQYSPSKGKYVIKTTVKGTTTYSVTGLKSGAEYQFKIKPYFKTSDGTVIWGSASSAFTTATEPSKPKVSLSSTSKGKVVVSWNNVSGETGYQIYYSTKKSSGYTKLTSVGANKTKATASKLSSGKTYYFKVRAHKKVNGKTIYGTFSSVKSIKVK